MGGNPHEHRVQFYGDDSAALATNVGRFAAEGMARGDGVLVIASAEHRRAFARAAASAGADVESAVRQGRWIALDATRTLEAFLVDGQPDGHRFRSVLDPAIRTLRSNGASIRAYGEMVGVLWRAEQFDAASQLEALWNRLLAGGGLELYCGYPIDIFGDAFRTADVDALLCAHTHVVPSGDARLQTAVTRAMRDVLERDDVDFDALIETSRPNTWPALPKGEAAILWLRNELPAYADEILRRARGYYSAA